MTPRDQRIRDLAEKLFISMVQEWEPDEKAIRYSFVAAEQFIAFKEKWCEERKHKHDKATGD